MNQNERNDNAEYAHLIKPIFQVFMNQDKWGECQGRICSLDLNLIFCVNLPGAHQPK